MKNSQRDIFIHLKQWNKGDQTGPAPLAGEEGATIKKRAIQGFNGLFSLAFLLFFSRGFYWFL